MSTTFGNHKCKQTLNLYTIRELSYFDGHDHQTFPVVVPVDKIGIHISLKSGSLD